MHQSFAEPLPVCWVQLEVADFFFFFKSKIHLWITWGSEEQSAVIRLGSFWPLKTLEWMWRRHRLGGQWNLTFRPEKNTSNVIQHEERFHLVWCSYIKELQPRTSGNKTKVIISWAVSIDTAVGWTGSKRNSLEFRDLQGFAVSYFKKGFHIWSRSTSGREEKWKLVKKRLNTSGADEARLLRP